MGLGSLFLAIFTCVALYTYNESDPGFNQSVSARHTVLNKAGLVGAYWGGFLAESLGVWSYLVPFWIAWRGLRFLVPRVSLPFWRGVGAWSLAFIVLLYLGSPWGIFGLSLGAVRGGGGIGHSFFGFLNYYLSPFGAYTLLFFALIAAVQLTFGLTWENFWQPFMAIVNEQCWRVLDAWQAWRDHRAASREERQEQGETSSPVNRPSRPSRKVAPSPEDDEAAPQPPIPVEVPSEAVDRFLDAVVEQAAVEKAAPKPRAKEKNPPQEMISESAVAPTPKKVAAASPAKPVVKSVAAGGPIMPPLDLLSVPPVAENAPVDPELCRRQSESLITCLNDFGIQGEVQRVVPGPVVTMFEVKPAPGVKISRIVGLSVDLALAMKALAVRIEGPIPGKDTVGVEIPNAKRNTVYFRDILDAETFRTSTSKITLAIGKDIQGRPQVADLARMPHLLVAGATGSGKSVCINGILLSILYKATPEEVKLLLVDPKRIELSVYNDLPHLVHPVVTETAMAKSALDWAVSEMDRRYEAMALLGVRNIAGYNEKLQKLGDNRPEEFAALEPLPYLVIVIDELADLMKLERTSALAYTLTPNTSPARWSQRVSNNRADAPETRKMTDRTKRSRREERGETVATAISSLGPKQTPDL